MKKLLLKSVLFVLIIAGIFYSASCAYKQTNTYKNVDVSDDTAKFASMPASIDVAVFGASHGLYGFTSAPEGSSFFNFCLSSQTPRYDFRLMRQYQDRFNPNTLVIMTVSYISPFWQETDSILQAKQNRYYRILSPDNIIDVDIFQYCLKKYFPVLTASVTDLTNAVFHDPAALFIGPAELRMVPDTISADQERITRDHWGVVSPVFPETEPKMMESFRQMLTMCKENGWTAVLVTPPYPKVYSDCFPAAFFPVFRHTVNSLAEEFDVPYLDYSHESEYAENYDLFLNIDHLNMYGAEQFDAEFYADLDQLGIWPANKT